MIYKAGEIIPEISTVLKDKRTGKEEIFEMPKTCPICGEPVHRIEGEAAYRCTNPNCGGVVREKLIHFASRDAMDIEGMGPSVVDSLLAARLVNDPGDFYRLKQEDMEQMERMGEKVLPTWPLPFRTAKEEALPNFSSVWESAFWGRKELNSSPPVSIPWMPSLPLPLMKFRKLKV